MRAAANLEALCELFTVTLALINPDPAELEHIAPKVRDRVALVIAQHRSFFDKIVFRLPGWRLKHLLQMIWPTPPAMARTLGALRNLAKSMDIGKFDVVHCYRIQSAPLTDFVSQGQHAPRFVLDLDDYESHARFRGLAGPRTGLFVAAAQLMEGLKYRMAEAEFIPRFDAVYVCSQLDRIALSRRFPNVKWEVIPNIVPSPPVQSRPVHTGFTFLFVGTLDYAPNKDAVVFFSEEVLPLLRKATSVPFRVRIVGRNPDETVIGLANGNDVEVIANPADVAPYYSEADVCIAPIRGGGGTRIKILEAFSHKLPVVSTTIGSEGLDTVSSVDIEIADSADDFAIACARLLKDSEQRARLAAAGYEVYQSRFSSTMLARLFRGIHANQHANIALISS